MSFLKAFLLCIAFFSWPLSAQKTTRSVNLDLNGEISINSLVDKVSSITKMNLIVDPGLKGKVFIISQEPVSIPVIKMILASALDSVGYTLVETSSISRIVKKQHSKLSHVRIFESNEKLPFDLKVVIKVLMPKYVSVDFLAKKLTSILPAISVQTYEPDNVVFLTAPSALIRRMEHLIRLLDSKSGRNKVVVVPLYYLSAKEVAAQIRNIFIKVSRRQKPEDRLIIADEKRNHLIVYGPPGFQRQVKEFLASLKKASQSEDYNPRYYFYPLEFRKSKDIAARLNAINLKSSFLQLPGKKFSKRDQPTVKIIADEETNSLIIESDKKTYTSLTHIIRKLDQKRAQVFLEIAIIDMHADYGFKFGSSTVGPGGAGPLKGGKWVSGWRSAPMAPVVLAQSTAAQSDKNLEAVKDIAGSFSESLTVGVFSSKKINIAGLGAVSPGALIQMMKTDEHSRLITSPYLLTTTDEEATFLSGETLFYKKSKFTPEGFLKTESQKEDVSLSLKVKPSVHRLRYLSLKIDLDADFIININEDGTPVVGRRKIRQDVELRDGQTVFLTGLHKSRQLESYSKIPLLSDIPILGWLFRSQTKQYTDSRFVVTITPHILETAEDLHNLSLNRKSILSEVKSHLKSL